MRKMNSSKQLLFNFNCWY